MDWKKIVVSASLLAAVSAPCAFAADWVFFYKTSEDEQYYDRDTVEYSPETDKATVWTKSLSSTAVEMKIVQEELDFKKKTFTQISDIAVYKDHHPAPTMYKRDPTPSKIIPGTAGSELYTRISKEVNRDEQLKEYKEKQERKERNERAENAVKKGIGLIGGWL